MAENQKQQDQKVAEKQSDDQKTNPGTPDPSTMTSTESVVGEKVGLSEGEVKALRDDAGLNQLAGNEANTLSWEASPSGQAFKDSEKERAEKYKDEAKRYEEAQKKDGLTEAEVEYKEAVDKARKG